MDIILAIEPTKQKLSGSGIIFEVHLFMKQFLILIAFISLNMGHAFAQVEITTTISFDNLQHDFGDVYEDDSAVHFFTFKNTGTVPLVISEMKSTCSCTATDWPKEAVLPGKTGKIRVSFSTKDKNGYYAKGVNMFSNAGESNMIIDIHVLPKPKK